MYTCASSRQCAVSSARMCCCHPSSPLRCGKHVAQAIVHPRSGRRTVCAPSYPSLDAADATLCGPSAVWSAGKVWFCCLRVGIRSTRRCNTVRLWQRFRISGGSVSKPRRVGAIPFWRHLVLSLPRRTALEAARLRVPRVIGVPHVVRLAEHARRPSHSLVGIQIEVADVVYLRASTPQLRSPTTRAIQIVVQWS